MTFQLQPVLESPSLVLRPLETTDFEALYQAASDPLIWAVHPQPTRYRREVFQTYFESAMASRGAFAILDKATGKIIGSSRYYNFNADLSEIAIGYTFMTRAYWGGVYNRELKSLMINHALQFVHTVNFEVGTANGRSRRAMEKIGGQLIGEALLDGQSHVIYAITSRLSE